MRFEGSAVTAANANYLIADRGAGRVGPNACRHRRPSATYDAYGAPGYLGDRQPVQSCASTTPPANLVIPEAKLYYYKARVYDPVSGKFLQTDPVGDQSDLNLYAYVRGDPLSNSDPSGDVIVVPIESQRPSIAAMINAKSKTQYSFDKGGRLIESTSAKANPHGSNYYSSKLNPAIKSNAVISVTVTQNVSYGPAQSSTGAAIPNTDVREHLDDASPGGGLTVPQPQRGRGDSNVFVSGHGTTVLGRRVPAPQSPQDILAHELAWATRSQERSDRGQETQFVMRISCAVKPASQRARLLATPRLLGHEQSYRPASPASPA